MSRAVMELTEDSGVRRLEGDADDVSPPRRTRWRWRAARRRARQHVPIVPMMLSGITVSLLCAAAWALCYQLPEGTLEALSSAASESGCLETPA